MQVDANAVIQRMANTIAQMAIDKASLEVVVEDHEQTIAELREQIARTETPTS